MPDGSREYDIAAMFASSRPLVIDVGAINADAQQGSNILNCSGRNWGDDCLAGKLIEIYEGSGSPQMHVIEGNSRSGVVISGGVQPAVKSGARYRIYGAGPKDTGLISYSGTTTADGAADGSTLVCSGLVGRPDFDGNLVVVQSGAYRGQARDINGVTTAGTVTPHLAFGGQMPAGARFTIYALRLTSAEVAALEALLVALMADVGDASTSTLGSLFDILGDPAVSISDTLALIIASLAMTNVDDNITTDGTEQDIYLNNAPGAVFYPRNIQLNTSNMVGGDVVVVREYYRIRPAGGMVLKDSVAIDNKGNPLKNIELEENRYGVQVTVERTAGGDRSYDYRLIYGGV